MDTVFDVAVIGGGINGCGAAADASMRGLSIILLEKEDIASKTSSRSSKLIHGGLRYLEHYDFALVKKALDERQLLLNLAPHLVHPIPFVLPYQEHMRPRWLLRTGLFFYDNLSRTNQLPHSKWIDRENNCPYFAPLSDLYQKGFLYYDCATDDARLTIANAIQAKEHGALIVPNSEVLAAETIDNIWHLNIQTASEQRIIRAKSIINATGPWVNYTNRRLHIPDSFKLSLVQGSHIVIPKLYNGNHAYLLQNKDQRIIFIIPYQGYSMIGTTDVAFSGLLDEVNISKEEVDYLLHLVNSYLDCKIEKNQIVHTWSGVRPLIAADGDSLSALSRDYICNYTDIPAPAVTIYGGKITTYRQSSMAAVNHLLPVFPYLAKSDSANHCLPGAEHPDFSFEEFCHHANEKYFWVPKELRERFLNSYGTRTELLLDGLHNKEDLGRHFGHGLYQIELDFLMKEEWATCCDDILWRRTKMGLHFNSQEKANVMEYLGR